MEKEELRRISHDLAARLIEPGRVIAVESAARWVSLLIDWSHSGVRRRMVIDVDPAHPTLHLAPAGREPAIASMGGFCGGLPGLFLTAVEMAEEPSLLRFVFHPFPAAAPSGSRIDRPEARVLMAEWTGASGNLRLLDGEGLVLESSAPGGPRPGEAWRPPRRLREASAGDQEPGGEHPTATLPSRFDDGAGVEDLHAALALAHRAALSRTEAENRRRLWIREVERGTRRLLRLRENLLRERVDPEFGPRLRRGADAILANLHSVKKGDPRFEFPDWAHPGAMLRLDLDPAKTPVQNAQDCFRRARRWERGEPHRKRRLEEIDKAVARLSALEVKTRDAEDLPGEIAFARRLDEALGIFRRPGSASVVGPVAAGGPGAARRATRAGTGGEASSADSRSGDGPRAGRGGGGDGRATGAAHGSLSGPRERRDRKEQQGFHPRSYQTRDGWTVLVGRSNQENDYLTHRVAHPEDYWFHAHGVPGSHVVLRREGRKDNPSAKTIEEAAAIAAFFSKARHSSKAPVIYTLKKYVRKPRGAKAGLAMCQREKSIMVLPKDPAEGREPEWMEE